ncbi:MAG TPA: hypothetical protein VHX18_04950 [Rhizomicrobium sp.]|nr:hypothetical protein [Rhizomicrobium sp.]
MDNLDDYHIRFLDTAGGLLDVVVLAAETVTVASERAGEIARQIAAANFSIMLLPPKLADTSHM